MKALRWFLVLPAAIAGMLVLSFATGIAISACFGTGEYSGWDIGGNWRGVLYNGCKSFFAPFGFVGIGGIVAPSLRKPTAVALAIALVSVAACVKFGTGESGAAITVIVNATGALVGAVFVWKEDASLTAHETMSQETTKCK